jgi:hypothetical protein
MFWLGIALLGAGSFFVTGFNLLTDPLCVSADFGGGRVVQVTCRSDELGSMTGNQAGLLSILIGLVIIIFIFRNQIYLSLQRQQEKLKVNKYFKSDRLRNTDSSESSTDNSKSIEAIKPIYYAVFTLGIFLALSIVVNEIWLGLDYIGQSGIPDTYTIFDTTFGIILLLILPILKNYLFEKYHKDLEKFILFFSSSILIYLLVITILSDALFGQLLFGSTKLDMFDRPFRVWDPSQISMVIHKSLNISNDNISLLYYQWGYLTNLLHSIVAVIGAINIYRFRKKFNFIELKELLKNFTNKLLPKKLVFISIFTLFIFSSIASNRVSDFGMLRYLISQNEDVETKWITEMAPIRSALAGESDLNYKYPQISNLAGSAYKDLYVEVSKLESHKFSIFSRDIDKFRGLYLDNSKQWLKMLRTASVAGDLNSLGNPDISATWEILIEDYKNLLPFGADSFDAEQWNKIFEGN